MVFLSFFLFNKQIYAFTLNDDKYLKEEAWPSNDKLYSRMLGYYMIFIHFIKRVFECMFIHIFSKSTKSLNKLIWEMAYNWLFFGVGVGYYLFHPHYKESIWENEVTIVPISYCLMGAFIFCEIMNYMCHLHLRSFRKKDGDKRIGLPTDHGFSTVSCANYFWEIIAWTIFAFTT